jgi:hypothetical protein
MLEKHIKSMMTHIVLQHYEFVSAWNYRHFGLWLIRHGFYKDFQGVFQGNRQNINIILIIESGFGSRIDRGGRTTGWSGAVVMGGTKLSGASRKTRTAVKSGKYPKKPGDNRSEGIGGHGHGIYGDFGNPTTT